jgi:hypothetical protein
MEDLICMNPPIARSNLHLRILHALARGGCARELRRGFFTVDWEKAQEMFPHHLRNIGPGSWEMIAAWAGASRDGREAGGQFALPECPICRRFHENNHGGLE